MIPVALAAILVLHPAVTEETPLRLVADGDAGATYTWYLDGVRLGTTNDREPVQTTVPAGQHEVAVHSDQDGAWGVVVRPDPLSDGVTYVPGWTATTPGDAEATPRPGGMVWPVLLGLAAILLVARRRGPKRP